MKKLIEFYSKGSITEIIIRIVVTIALILLLYWLAKKGVGAIGNALNNAQDQNTINQIVAQTPAQDGSQPTNDFKAQARFIADTQHNEMLASNTDENTMFSTLIDLSGAQLQQVFAEFGIRDGKNLFSWYTDQLCGSFYCGLYYNDERVPGCDSWLSSCTELDYMKAIWQKSGLPF